MYVCPLTMQLILRPLIGRHGSNDNFPGLSLVNPSGVQIECIHSLCVDLLNVDPWCSLNGPPPFFFNFLLVVVPLFARAEIFSVSRIRFLPISRFQKSNWSNKKSGEALLSGSWLFGRLRNAGFNRLIPF